MAAPTEVIRIKSGTKHKIELKGSGTTGYQWVASPEKATCFTIDKKFATKGLKKELLGASANEIFIITGTLKGKASLLLRQIKTWEKNPVPAREIRYEIIVE